MIIYIRSFPVERSFGLPIGHQNLHPIIRDMMIRELAANLLIAAAFHNLSRMSQYRDSRFADHPWHSRQFFYHRGNSPKAQKPSNAFSSTFKPQKAKQKEEKFTNPQEKNEQPKSANNSSSKKDASKSNSSLHASPEVVNFFHLHGGIQPTNGNPHSFLGVSRDATKDQINKAYRGLAKKIHPDKHNSDRVAAEAFSFLESARSIALLNCSS